MGSKTCRFQQLLKHRNTELLLLLGIISPYSVIVKIVCLEIRYSYQSTLRFLDSSSSENTQSFMEKLLQFKLLLCCWGRHQTHNSCNCGHCCGCCSSYLKLRLCLQSNFLKKTQMLKKMNQIIRIKRKRRVRLFRIFINRNLFYTFFLCYHLFLQIIH